MVEKNTPKFYSSKAHYDALWQRVDALENPTIADAARVMQEMGNVGWFDADPNATYEKVREIEFEAGSTLHEAGHIMAYAGHTPYQEGFAGALMEGFGLAHSDDMQEAFDSLARTQGFYKRSGRNFYRENFDKIADKITYQPRDTAINYAAGIYLYQKINALFNQPEDKQTYEARLAFSQDYAKHDIYDAAAPKTSAEEREDKDQYDALPADLLKLSRKEWRAIIAVATGLHDAKDTPYPNRLQPIQEKLTAMDIRHDIGKDKKQGKHAQGILKKRAEKEVKQGPHGGWEGESPRR